MKYGGGMNELPYPSDLTAAQWALIEPLLPAPKPKGRKRRVDLRKITNAIFYVLKGGISWRSVYSVRPHPRQPRKAVLQPLEHQLAAIAVLHIGAGDRYGQDQTQYIDHDMPLTTLGELRSIVAPIAPFCCVATLWLSTIAAFGQICRPLLIRT